MSGKKLYHISPNTGIPSICRATSGKCPFGGDSGGENHFNSFSEAQEAAQKRLEEMYDVLPKTSTEEIKEIVEEKRVLKADELKRFMSLGLHERAEEAFTTDNQDLLRGIINGEFDEFSFLVTGPALQNKNMPREIIQDILIENPDSYSQETQLWAASNLGLSERDIGYIYINRQDNKEVQAVALQNRNVDPRLVSGVMKRRTLEELADLPYAAIYMNKKLGYIRYVEETREEVTSMPKYSEVYERAQEISKTYIPFDEKPKIFSII